MSVNHELVEVQHSKTGKWMAIDGAVLDTGNAVMTTITPTWRRQLGLSLSGETTKVQGVTDKLEEWALTEPIKVRTCVRMRVCACVCVCVGTRKRAWHACMGGWVVRVVGRVGVMCLHAKCNLTFRFGSRARS